MTNDSLEEQREIVEEFVQECTDLIDQLEPSIIEMGNDIKESDFELSEDTRQLINEVFRLFHSIKGGAGFLALGNISTTAHAAENLLDEIRTGSILLNHDHVDLFCKTIDFTREALDLVAANLGDGGMETQAEELTTLLRTAISLKTTASEKPVAKKAAPPKKKNGPPPPPEPVKKEEPVFEFTITPDMVERFTQEADEQLQEVEQGLLKFADNKADPETLGELYRHIHSFKGNCGFMGFGDMEKLSHQMETVLDAIKSEADFGKAKPADPLLSLLDVLKQALGDISQNGKGKIEGVELYIDLLQDLLPEGWGSSKKTTTEKPPRVGEILIDQGVISEETLDQALDIQNKPIGKILIDMGAASEVEVDNALTDQNKKRKPAPSPDLDRTSPTAIKRQDIRVDLDKLDTLINLIGEMVIAENMLVHSPDLKGLELENFQKSAQQMSKLIKELQEVAVTIRMIPVAGLFRRMTRLVHDLSRKSGKKVDLQLFGTETDLDKTVIETITDPLVHLLRNSLDHGVETPDERLKNNKPETGIIKLSASHEEGEVWITLEDDGRGLNRDKIIKKAIASGLIDGDGSDLDDREVSNMIFLPGFSTADKITDVSGRGVGMDVVKQNLAKIDGKIIVDSRPGSGTRTTLRIPLTMAIIDGMLTRVGKSHYIVPILSIKESFRPTPKLITTSPAGDEIVRIREKLYPVIRLHEIHKIEPDSRELSEGILIMLEDGDNTTCLFVDEIMGQQQTVIKGLSEYIGKMGEARGVSGCTILSNGDVCLILDVGSLI
ncbi:MAG: chemotaxis protein CheA [Proteobacteria bacterium]|nr:chemotaxis protein CheA [Pseudomonadota bacterium]MBU1717072.1 chemotaxis protein CheA [Pseudomonadota bacterium]